MGGRLQTRGYRLQGRGERGKRLQTRGYRLQGRGLGVGRFLGCGVRGLMP
jgi:hypothetical protein